MGTKPLDQRPDEVRRLAVQALMCESHDKKSESVIRKIALRDGIATWDVAFHLLGASDAVGKALEMVALTVLGNIAGNKDENKWVFVVQFAAHNYERFEVRYARSNGTGGWKSFDVDHDLLYKMHREGRIDDIRQYVLAAFTLETS